MLRRWMLTNKMSSYNLTCILTSCAVSAHTLLQLIYLLLLALQVHVKQV